MWGAFALSSEFVCGGFHGLQSAAGGVREGPRCVDAADWLLVPGQSLTFACALSVAALWLNLSTTTLERSKTCWPGRSTRRSPPLGPCQPPSAVRWSTPALLAVAAKRRVSQSHTGKV